ncbi:unnamed protein product [Ectocarpus sp. 12 AP-2014]
MVLWSSGACAAFSMMLLVFRGVASDLRSAVIRVKRAELTPCRLWYILYLTRALNTVARSGDVASFCVSAVCMLLTTVSVRLEGLCWTATAVAASVHLLFVA